MPRDEYIAHSESYKGYDIEIVQDEDCSSPRENDNLGTIIAASRGMFSDEVIPSYYDSPYRWLRQLACDKVRANDPEVITDEHIERILHKYYVILAIDVFDYGYNARVRVADDVMSQDVDGYIYADREKIFKEYSVSSLDEIEKAYSESARTMCERLFRSEISELNNWLESNCWGYRIVRDGEEIESCWGFIGDWDDKDYSVLTEAKSIVDYYARQDKLISNRVKSVRNNLFKRIGNKLLTWAKGR